MTEPIDPVTTALTGKLPLLSDACRGADVSDRAGGPAALCARGAPLDAQQAHGAQTAAAGVNGSPAASGSPAATRPATLRDLAEPSSSAAADTLLARLLAGPQRAAVVYAVAGIGYGVAMTTAQLLADGLAFLPVRFLFLTWIFAWPVVLTIGVVAADDQARQGNDDRRLLAGADGDRWVRHVEEP